jgi:choline dehydrogenase
MYYVHPAKEEVNAWHDLIAPSNTSAAAVWGWDSFFTTLKATETFTPPSADIQNAVTIQYSQSSHGNSGNLHTTYPG